MGLVWLLVCGVRPAGGSTPEASYLGSHPHAREQPTERGRTIGTIEAFGGRLYVGYGDTFRNTGPIVVSSYEPATAGWADHLVFRTEEIGRFRLLGDSLWAPAFDPQGRDDIGYARGDGSHQWAAHPVAMGPRPVHSLGPVHTYDAAARGTATEWFLSGAYDESDGGGVARYTPETGWTVSLSVPGAATRFYNLAELDGRLYTVLGGVADNLRDDDVGENSYVYDGVRWARGPKLHGFVKPLSFAGRLVYRSEDRRLLSFDGTRVDELPVSGAVDHDSEGETLVVISRSDRRLYSTADLRTWREEGTIPPTASAVGLADGVAYIGTSTSELYALPLRPS